jgi:hypothetical protein
MVLIKPIVKIFASTFLKIIYINKPLSSYCYRNEADVYYLYTENGKKPH